MRKIFLVTALTLFLVSFVFSQTYDYIDEFTTDLYGKMAIVSNGGQRDENGNYSGGKWGMISAKKPGTLGKNTNKDRNIVEAVPLKYDYIKKNESKFIEYTVTYFIAAIGGEWIDGKLINAKYGIIDTKGKEVVTPTFDFIVKIDKGPFFLGMGGNLTNGAYVGTKWQVFYNGKILPKSSYDYVETNPYVAEIKTKNGIFYDSRMLVSAGGEWLDGKYVGGKYGYLQETGKEKVPLKYDGAEPFIITKAVTASMNGYGGSAVVWRAFVQSEGKWGMINGAGQVFIPLKYDTLRPIIVGQNQARERVAVKVDGKWGFVRGNGLDAIPCTFEEVTDFKKNPNKFLLNFAGFKINGKWGIIDENGKEVISPKYDEVIGFYGNLFGVKNDNKYGFLDTKGEEIIPPSIENAVYLSNKLVLIKKEGKWGIIKEDGKEFVAPKYDEIGDVIKLSKKNKELKFMTRVAVKIGEKWGFLNEKGEEIVPMKYDEVKKFKDLVVKGNKNLILKSVTASAVKSNEKWGFINENGEEIIPLKYNDVKDFQFVSEIKGIKVDYHTRTVVKNDENKWGIVDINGKEIVPLKYDEIGNFYNIRYDSVVKVSFVSRATVRLGEKYGVLDLIKGTEITPVKYDSINGFKGLISSVKADGKLKFINIDGSEIEIPINCDENWKFASFVEAFNAGENESDSEDVEDEE